jgi:pimeloyl-ACP methyl ester carboxylesterase
MAGEREHDGWIVRESGPRDADHTVLLLPGALCTAPFYDDLVEHPKLSGESIRFVAATLQGFGGTPPPADLSMEGDARRAGRLAADFGCDAVVGHSLGANVAIEMVAAGEFSGPAVLLAPSFSREDEMKEIAILDRIGRIPVLGQLAWMAMLRTIGSAMNNDFPGDRHDALVAEMKKNDPGLCRRKVRCYFEYLDHHGSVAGRLCDSGAKAWVVFGQRDDVGLTDGERSRLDDCPRVAMVSIPDAGHFTLNEEPGRIADVVLAALASAPATA